MPLTKIQSLGITDGTIVNADINASAAIDGTKLTGVGKVLQVVTATDSSSLSSSSASYVDTGLTASITPSSASNKILVLVSMGTLGSDSDNNAGATIGLIRGATELAYSAGLGAHPTITFIYTAGVSFAYLDSPSTTSSTTYKTQFKTSSGTGFVIDSGSIASIVLLEIAG
jgi:hypothetical protein